MPTGETAEMIEESLAYDILGKCLAGRTHQIARIVSSLYDQALAEHGITSNQLTLLSMVRVMQPVAARDMLPFLKMDQSTLSRNLDRLEVKGWIEVRSADQDNRERLILMTTIGSRILQSAHGGWEVAQQSLIQSIGENAADHLRRTAHSLNPLLPLSPDQAESQSKK